MLLPFNTEQLDRLYRRSFLEYTNQRLKYNDDAANDDNNNSDNDTDNEDDVGEGVEKKKFDDDNDYLRDVC